MCPGSERQNSRRAKSILKKVEIAMETTFISKSQDETHQRKML